MHDVQQLVVGAMQVDPDRIAMPSPAGLCDPRTILTGSKLIQFNEMLPAVPVQPLGPLPKACHKVKPECEHKLYCKLLETGMCVLALAEKVPRDEAGRPLVEAICCFA